MTGNTKEPREIVAVPVVEERARIRKRRRITGALKARTVVREREEVVEVPVGREDLVVERIACDRWLDAPEQVRQEGGTTVIPIHEEVLVVEKRLKLVGEVRITRRSETSRERHRVVLRREDVDVVREPVDDASSA